VSASRATAFGTKNTTATKDTKKEEEFLFLVFLVVVVPFVL
jgi:hypothetical protein